MLAVNEAYLKLCVIISGSVRLYCVDCVIHERDVASERKTPPASDLRCLHILSCLHTVVFTLKDDKNGRQQAGIILIRASIR